MNVVMTSFKSWSSFFDLIEVKAKGRDLVWFQLKNRDLVDPFQGPFNKKEPKDFRDILEILIII